ncbi:hypothetical protein IT400_04425 [Candidatus Nomurabacteria bacterium]|nr:hypothetical protein [Candidatus Nomurabacteria bacterium]
MKKYLVFPVLAIMILLDSGCSSKTTTTRNKTVTTTQKEKILPLRRSDVYGKKGNRLLTPSEMLDKPVFNSDEIKIDCRVGKRIVTDEDGTSVDSTKIKAQIKTIPEGTEGRIIELKGKKATVLFSYVDADLYVNYYMGKDYWYLHPRDGRTMYYKDLGMRCPVYSEVGSKLNHKKKVVRKKKIEKTRAEGYQG